MGMTFSCWPHWRLRLCRFSGEGWQIHSGFNVGYGCVGGEGRGWRVHAGFTVGRGSVGEEGGGRGGGILLASLKTEDGGFLLASF